MQVPQIRVKFCLNYYIAISLMTQDKFLGIDAYKDYFFRKKKISLLLITIFMHDSIRMNG